MILLICLNLQYPLEGYEKFLMVGILLGTVILICISIMSKRYYQTIGTLYMFLGTMFFFYFIYQFVLKIFSRSWIYIQLDITPVESIWFFPLCLGLLGSLVLMVLGLVLVVRGGVWVARVSGVLLGFLSFILIGIQPSYFYLFF